MLLHNRQLPPPTSQCAKLWVQSINSECRVLATSRSAIDRLVIPAIPLIADSTAQHSFGRGRAEHVGSAPISDVDLLGNCKRVIDLDAEVSDGALDLGMAQQ